MQWVPHVKEIDKKFQAFFLLSFFLTFSRSNNSVIKMTLYITNCTIMYQIKAKCMTNAIKFIL